jgi:hypothetical protein
MSENVVEEESIGATPILEDVINRLNHELNQVSRIAAAPSEVQQKTYAISIVLNLMIILKDLSGLSKDIVAAADAEVDFNKQTRSRGLIPNSVYIGIGNKIKMAHAIIKNLVQLYKINYKTFASLDQNNYLGGESIFTSPSLETKIVGDNTDDWYIGRETAEGEEIHGFGIKEIPSTPEEPQNGGYRKSYKYGRRSRRRNTRKISKSIL